MMLMYEGKAKKVFSTDNAEVLRLEFKNSLTAFNAQKTGSFEGKGQLNCEIATLIFKRLASHGVPTHFINQVSGYEMLVKKVEIIPLEVVVRNILAGSTAKKMGFEEGSLLTEPLIEFYFKKDELNDPFVSDDQVIAFNLATAVQIRELKQRALQINKILLQVFIEADMKLVDFKIEFGVTSSGQIILADEISPDCCRLWDVKTSEKMDKDRFRRDLGQIKETYQEVLLRLKKNSAKQILGVRVMPREVILDTQGRAVEQSLKMKGHNQLNVRVGKYIRLEFETSPQEALRQAREIAQNMLHNPLIETFEIIEESL